LKEDYISSQIFGSAFIILFGFLVGLIGAKIFFPFLSLSLTFSQSGYYFWLCVLGVSIGYLISLWKYRFRFYETLEALGISLLVVYLIFIILDAFKNDSWSSLGYALVIFFNCGLFLFLDKKYKKFTWYRSGKVGFAGLTTFGVFFLIRALLALVFPFVLSFLGRIESILSAIIAFVFFLALFNLAQQKV